MEEPQIYFTNIEQVIMDNFDEASEFIKISVAWFTNKNLINKLISLKKEKKITVQILVDDNEINKKYFYDIFETDLQKHDIEIKKLKFKKFNHNKFCIIDNKIAITGFYNYTENANKNLENLVVVINPKIAEYYTRIFHFFTDLDYIDQNIDILFNNFYFANKLISTFYPFTRKLMSSLEDKLYLGYCFTHFNGLHDEMSYDAGLIFNPKWKYHKGLKQSDIKRKNNDMSIDDIHSDLLQEFPLPISKSLITDFKIDKISDLNFQAVYEIANYKLDNIDFEHFADTFKSNENAILQYYKSKFKNIFTVKELAEFIESDIDLIKEDYIWIINFSPFLNNDLIQKIYKIDSLNSKFRENT